MVCSRSVSVHLLRGAGAVGLIFTAYFLHPYGMLGTIIAGVGAIVLLRGCPMCWLMGLFETIHQGRDKNGPARLG